MLFRRRPHSSWESQILLRWRPLLNQVIGSHPSLILLLLNYLPLFIFFTFLGLPPLLFHHLLPLLSFPPLPVLLLSELLLLSKFFILFLLLPDSILLEVPLYPLLLFSLHLFFLLLLNLILSLFIFDLLLKNLSVLLLPPVGLLPLN